MDLEEIGINAGNWVDSFQDRDYWRALVNAAMNFRVPQVMELVYYYFFNYLTVTFFFNFCDYLLDKLFSALYEICFIIYTARCRK